MIMASQRRGECEEGGTRTGCDCVEGEKEASRLRKSFNILCLRFA
jgi:hypothetical protein